MSLSGATFADSTSILFTGAVLPDTIDFSYNAKIPTMTDFTTASFADSTHYDKASDIYFKPHYISLYKTDISKLHLDYIHFRLITDSTAHKKSSRFEKDEKFRIPTDEAEGMYEALLDNFKKNGQMESFKLLDIEYQKYKLENSSVPFLVIFPECWWNFGYSKARIFGWAALLLTLFTIINFFFLNDLNDVYKLHRISDIPTLRSASRIPRVFLKRMWLSFFYTSALFFSLTLKVDEFNYKKVAGTLYIMLMYTLGIVCLAYMANYILQK